MTRAGVRVTVVCPVGDGSEAVAGEEREGIRIRRFVSSPATGGVRSYATEYATAMRWIRRIVRELAPATRFDVVQACNPPDTLLLAARSARRRGAALVFDHHDLVPELFLSRFGDRRILHRGTLLAERLAFRSADVVLSTNESYRRVALGRGRKDPEEVFVVRNAPELDGFRDVPPDPALRAGKEHLLVYVGVLGPQDGIDHLLHALARLLGRRRDWRAVIAGDGDVLADMRRLAADLGLGDAVEFLGWVPGDAVPRILASADVCLVPDPPSPLNDVSSMVKLVEYMAMGRPVVAYRLGETSVTAGDAVAYAKDASPEALADAVDVLLDAPAERARLGAAARARVEAGLSWESQEPVLLAAYERAFAIADRRRRALDRA